MKDTEQLKFEIVEHVNRYLAGLITNRELNNALEKMDQARGGYLVETRQYTGYDYDNQTWIKFTI